MVAYYPGKALANNAVEWTIDGTIDIMLTNAIWDAGKYTAPLTGATGTKLTFNHQLSRVEVVLRAEASAALDVVRAAWGNYTKVEFVDAPSKMKYDLAGTPTVTTSDPVQFTLLANYEGSIHTSVPIWPSNRTDSNLGAMLAPVPPTATESFKLRVTTAGALSTPTTPIVVEVPVSLDGTNAPMTAGHLHKVFLTFKANNKEIEVTTSTVDGWQTGTGGNSDAIFTPTATTTRCNQEMN